MFYKGEFDIKDSWGTADSENSGGAATATPQINGGKGVKQTTVASSQTSLNKISRPTSSSNMNSNNKSPINSSTPYEKKGSAIASAAAKNLVGGSINSQHVQVDDDLAKRLIKNLQMEGHPEGLFQKKLSPVMPGGVSKKPPVGSGPSSSGLLKQGSGSGGDSDLLASMAARLAKAEGLVKSQREELKEKHREIEGLKTEIEIYKQSKDSEKSAEEMRRIRAENVVLLSKMHAMEKFLADYGLHWTKDEKTGDELLQGEFKKEEMLSDAKKPKYNYIVPSEIDLNVILRRIDELNMSVERDGGCQEVYKDDRGFNRIRRADPIPIGFYRDGIAIKGFKFFKYGSPEARQILADILEGYFPYQLKKDYPNGIQLKVIDRADDEYTTEKSSNKSANIHSVDEDALKPMSKDEFLAKIPKTMIKDGKIVQVRSEIEKKLDGQSKPIELQNVKNQLNALQSQQQVDENGQQQQQKKKKTVAHEVLDDGSIRVLTDEYKASKEGNNSSSSSSSKEVCELKIRTTRNGVNTVIFISISADKMIRDVYRLLDDFTELFNYSLATNFPKRIIPRDSTESLKELDMFPNSVLNVQEVK